MLDSEGNFYGPSITWICSPMIISYKHKSLAWLQYESQRLRASKPLNSAYIKQWGIALNAIEEELNRRKDE